MHANGNPFQWKDGHPSRALLQQDIDAQQLYVICDEEDNIHAVFALVIGEDSTYAQIEQGAWRSDAPYGAIHRVASDRTLRGVFSQCVAFSLAQIPHLRIDTHARNSKMQELILSHGFVYCGVIRVADGTPRNAYERVPE